jgi:hypothetical protein
MVVVLALYELLVIIASSRASDILYRVEPPVCNPSVNVTEFAILNVCTGSGECRAVCADEAWGKQIAQQICESWVKYHQVMAFNHTMPEKLSHRVGRVKLNCRANVAASCTATKVGSCATTRIAALNCKVGEDDYIEIESLKLKKLSKVIDTAKNLSAVVSDTVSLAVITEESESWQCGGPNFQGTERG